MIRKRFLRPLPPGLLNPINAKSMPKGSSLSLNRHGLESSSLEASTTASEKKAWGDATSDSDVDIREWIANCKRYIRIREENPTERLWRIYLERRLLSRECKRFHFSRTRIHWSNTTESKFSRLPFNWRNLTKALQEFTGHTNDDYLEKVRALKSNPDLADDFIQTIAGALYKDLPDGFVLWYEPGTEDHTFEEWYYRPFTPRVFSSVECMNTIPVVFVRREKIISVRWLRIK